MPTDTPEKEVPRNPEQERINPERSPSGDRSAQRGDKGSFGGEQPPREDQGENLDPNQAQQRNPEAQSSRDFEK